MKVLISAFRKENDLLTHINNHAELFDRITALGLTPQPVDGVWKGVSEFSYMVHGVTTAMLKAFYAMARDYNQEAILLVADDNRAAVVPTDGPVMAPMIDVGDWREVSKEIAIQFDGYTKTRDGRYFVAATREQFGLATRRLLATQMGVIAANEYAARVNAVGGL
ncbi:hypothetical protein PGT2_g00005 [Escherichia phage PGT2]|uniref:Uncharacterized protein n=1 Tax=Escherichia phage PGT2 TaxID=2047782 RepID=A0A2D2W2S0_9CAUD|nr:SAM-dependent methyltransferase [Escherichia phage PGT2]ATS92423.1 hypothetical protein PGT2_g00005 [Escherichia phage PGT2]